MAIRKKNTRLIECAEKKFQWTISPASHFVRFIAVSEENSGSKIEVCVQSDINRLWIEFPYVSDLNLKVIKPKDAASFILQALSDGWNPEEKGSTIKYRLVGEELKREGIINS
ncbi:hypothetical protein [Sabulibacter ruber]|uniref:hypothetical protein n=1 Tax=Sabulibacter ruber TaxID=2811901 RepID=UPI001A96EBAA|nr:hypothetical protein [Sabulibacter ruber]